MSSQVQRTIFHLSDIDSGWQQILVDTLQYARWFPHYADKMVQMSNYAFNMTWHNNVRVYIKTFK